MKAIYRSEITHLKLYSPLENQLIFYIHTDSSIYSAKPTSLSNTKIEVYKLTVLIFFLLFTQFYSTFSKIRRPQMVIRSIHTINTLGTTLFRHHRPIRITSIHWRQVNLKFMQYSILSIFFFQPLWSTHKRRIYFWRCYGQYLKSELHKLRNSGSIFFKAFKLYFTGRFQCLNLYFYLRSHFDPNFRPSYEIFPNFSSNWRNCNLNWRKFQLKVV